MQRGADSRGLGAAKCVAVGLGIASLRSRSDTSLWAWRQRALHTPLVAVVAGACFRTGLCRR